MLDRALQWAYARWGARYPKIALAIQFQASHFVVLAGVALLTIYEPMSDADFLRILVVTQALVLLDNLVALKLVYRLLRPVRAWLRGNRSMDQTVVAWRGLVDMPSEIVRRHWAKNGAGSAALQTAKILARAYGARNRRQRSGS